MKNLFILPLILMALFLGACSEAPMEPRVPEVLEMQIDLGLSKTVDYLPTTITTIPMVFGGSGNALVELYYDDALLSNDPVQTINFDENDLGEHLFRLKVTDLETDEVFEKTVTFTGYALPLGAPLENWLVSRDLFVFAGEKSFMSGGARGGSGQYRNEIFVNGVFFAEVAVMNVDIPKVGENEVMLRTTDLETNAVVESRLVVMGLNPDSNVMHVNLIALPQTVELGKKTGLVTVLHGGQAPFEFRIKVDGQVVATQPTYMYEMNTLGELIVMVEVTDATGAFESIGLSIFGVEPEIYEPPTTVRIVAPNEAQQRQGIPFQALVFGEYDLVEWYVVGYPAMIGMSDNITHNFQRLGFHDVEARVYYQGNFIVADTTRVTITPADENPPLILEIFGTPQGQTEPVDATLEAHPSGGDGNYQYAWYWPTAATLFSTERFPVREDLMAGDHTFICVLTDGVGATASGSLIIDVEEGSNPLTVDWSVGTSLKAGPSNRRDSEEIDTEQESSYNRVWFYIRMDVYNQDRETMTLEFVYADGSRRYWQIPDVLSERPAYLLVDGGEALIESSIEVNWIYPDGIVPDKCDGWNRVLEVIGSREVPPEHKGLTTVKVDGTSRQPMNISN